MFEVGMSALVLKICSEYAKSLGLNFPPCTQQEINAICEWVDKHTIKDMTISQNGYNVTFTFKTENDTTKEFTFTIPKKVDIYELEKVLLGSNTVDVVRLEDNSALQVMVGQSVINNINSKLAKPSNPTSESVVTMAANGTVGTKPLSEIGGGKLYRHDISIGYSEESILLYIVIYTTNSTLINTIDKLNTYSNDNYFNCIYSGFDGAGAVQFQVNNTTTFNLWGAIVARGQQNVISKVEHGITPTQITDTVTEV